MMKKLCLRIIVGLMAGIVISYFIAIGISLAIGEYTCTELLSDNITAKAVPHVPAPNIAIFLFILIPRSKY